MTEGAGKGGRIDLAVKSRKKEFRKRQRNYDLVEKTRNKGKIKVKMNRKKQSEKI